MKAEDSEFYRTMKAAAEANRERKQELDGLNRPKNFIDQFKARKAYWVAQGVDDRKAQELTRNELMGSKPSAPRRESRWHLNTVPKGQ